MKRIWQKVEDADTGDFQFAKKVDLTIPLIINDEKIKHLFIAQGMRFTVAAFKDKSTDSLMLAEAQTEQQLKAQLIQESDNLRLKIVEK